MGLTEKFETMVANGSFDNEVLRKVLTGFLALEQMIIKSKKSRYKDLIFLIVWVGKLFPDQSKDIAKLVSKEHKVAPVAKLVAKDVSPEADGKVLEDGVCAGCDSDDKVENKEETVEEKTAEDDDENIVEKVIEKNVESGNLSDAKTADEVISYFDSDMEKIDSYIKTMGIKTRAESLIGKAKAILSTFGTEE